MTSDRRNDEVESDLSWFEGLAGRGDGSKAAKDGERVRAALLDSGAGEARAGPDWGDVVERGGAGVGFDARSAPAANEPIGGPWRWAVAAMVAVAVTLGVWRMTSEDPSPKMRGSGDRPAAVWRTPTPKDSAERLAADLRALGASVSVSPQSDGAFVVRVVASEAVRGAVNGRLASLEAALDSRGGLELLVGER